jgi:hypothetical protein
MMTDVITPPHFSSFLLTPPQKSGSNGTYYTTFVAIVITDSSNKGQQTNTCKSLDNRYTLHRAYKIEFRFVQISITFIQFKAIRLYIVVNEVRYVQEDPISPKCLAAQSDKVSFDMTMPC